MKNNASLSDAKMIIEDEFESYLDRCVKRDTPIVWTAEALFNNDYPLPKEEFIEYLDYLNEEWYMNLENLFWAMNKNVNFSCKTITIDYKWDEVDSSIMDMLHFSFNNQLDGIDVSFDLPYNQDLQHLIFEYIRLEYSIECTFDEITSVLNYKR